MKSLTCILLMGSAISCQPSPEKEITKFKIPLVLTTQDTTPNRYLCPDSMSSSWPRFISKYRFIDTVSITNDRDTALRKDLLDWRKDTLGNDGFQLRIDYNATTTYRRSYEMDNHYYYPVFLINETATDKTLIGKDSYVFALQEAVDSNRRWRPIESRGFDFCGNGYWNLVVHPREFALFLMPKYEGSFETWLRVRLLVGNNLYVSEPFKGRVNPRQFYMKEKDFIRKDLREDPAGAIQTWFYGAIPAGYNTHTVAHAVWSN